MFALSTHLAPIVATTLAELPWLWMLGGLVLLALLVWTPRWGLRSRLRRYRQWRERVHNEDALKHIYHATARSHPATLQSLAGALQVTLNRAAEIVAALEKRALISRSKGEMRLSDEGRRYALHIIRAHRLWEKHLADQTGINEAEWHHQAERQEHRLTEAEADRLAAQLGHPIYDPHGDPIPTASGEMVPPAGVPLPSLNPGQRACIVHIEDEPDAVYRQLIELGLHPGQTVEVLSVEPGQIRFQAGGRVHQLAPTAAANLSVQPLPDDAGSASNGWTLDRLQPGQSGKVMRISPRCRGAERRRLMDLGIVPGTVITAELQSPAGDPVAYRVRDTLIALRREQAQLIHVEPMAQAA